MPKALKAKFHGVRVGRIPGVYETWPEAEAMQYVGTSKKSSILSSINAASSRHAASSPSSFKLPGRASPPRYIPPLSIPATAAPRAASPSPSSLRPPQPANGPALSHSQLDILDRVVKGENFFFTGSAGTGKSVLLRAIIDEFKQREYAERQAVEEKRIELAQRYMSGQVTGMTEEELDGMEGGGGRWRLAVTASTGMAAVNIGGCTLHSWAGIGLGKLPASKLADNIVKNKMTLRRWQQVGALIIDEVSMLDADLLEKLEYLGRRLRDSPKPFGGIQLILSGDFHQLPPVPDRLARTTPRFAFEAACWSDLFPSGQMKALTQVYRQRDDSFVKILERMRKGIVRQDDVLALRRCARPVEYTDGIEPVSLYPSKAEVADINAKRLRELESPVQIFLSHDAPGTNSRGYPLTPEEATELLDRNTIWAQELKLKVGALVMLVTNMQDGQLVNGSTGIVSDFLTLSEAHTAGVYVPERAFREGPSDKVAFPVVDFAPPSHLSTGGKRAKVVRALMPQMTVTVNNAQGNVEASRSQMPLVLCWGMTIHKSQGQSIDRLRVDLARIFERGQTYVALSRATNLDTLELHNFSAAKVMAHQTVIDWSKPMEEEQAMEDEWDALVANADLEGLE